MWHQDNCRSGRRAAVDPPRFLKDPDFQGVTFAKLGVTIPSEYLELDPGSSLTIEITNAAIGTTGFTGAVAVVADSSQPVTGTFLGFPFRFRELRINMVQNAILEAALAQERYNTRLAKLRKSGILVL